jgi:hypothetical protein
LYVFTNGGNGRKIGRLPYTADLAHITLKFFDPNSPARSCITLEYKKGAILVRKIPIGDAIKAGIHYIHRY